MYSISGCYQPLCAHGELAWSLLAQGMSLVSVSLRAMLVGHSAHCLLPWALP